MTIQKIKQSAFLIWLVLVGTNVVAFYSTAAPFQAALILAGFGYVVVYHRRQAMRVLADRIFLLTLFLLSAPAPLMIMDERGIDRASILSQLLVALIFAIVCVIAVRPEFDSTLMRASLVIVAFNAALNIYVLVTGMPDFSVGGRSSGFYTNPNLSSEAILGFGLVFLTIRGSRFNWVDFAVMSMVAVGVFATFSRTGMFTSVVLMIGATVLRAQPQQVLKIVAGILALTIITVLFGLYAVQNLELSPDVVRRISSIVEGGGVGDYQVDRGLLVLEWLEVFYEKPVFGSGPYTIADAVNGPHNMFLAIAVEYGLIGLAVYVLVMISLARTGLRADRRTAAFVLLYVGWLTLFGFASHNLLFNASTISLLAIAVASCYRIRYHVQPVRVDP